MMRSIVLDVATTHRLEAQLKKNIQGMDIKNNYGVVIHSSTLSELTVTLIGESDTHVQIEFEHNDPAMHSPVDISIAKNRIRSMFDDVVVEDLVAAGLAL